MTTHEMHARETIVAVASPPGRGARALIRVSGPGARRAAETVFHATFSRRAIRSVRARCAAGTVPVIAYWMPGPASFTGEDALEVSCVGAPALVDSLIDALMDGATSGEHKHAVARRARPGEFAFRAHLAGRLSVDEAESIAARIAATADAELAAADAIARGEHGLRAAEILARTAELLALVEAGIDFTDQEDVVAIEAHELAHRAEALAFEIDGARGGGASLAANAVATIVLAGAPNAGKSSLFNALVGKTRTVVSARAGSTRDAIRTRVALGLGLEADIVDLAGIDAPFGVQSEASCASMAVETSTRENTDDQIRCAVPTSPVIASAMQARVLELLSRADIVVRCTPASMTPLALPVQVSSSAIMDVRTKCDVVERSREESRQGPVIISTSARTGEGIDTLRTALANAIRRDHALRSARLSTILPRYDAEFATAAQLLRTAALHAARSAQSAHRSRAVRDPEIVASLLRSALDALGAIAGPMHPDDVLGLVFSRFCVGK